MTPFAHPLVDRYLSELAELLAGVPVADRAETMAGVSEHIEASLPAGHTDDDIRRVLEQLGPPRAVADEAYASFRPLDAQRTEVPNPRHWMPILACVLMILALLVLLVIFAGTPGSTETSTTSSDASGHVTTTHVDHLDPQPGLLLLVGAVATGPFWLAATVLALLAPTWRSRERTLVIALVPAIILATSLLPWLGGAVGGVTGQTLMAWLSLLLMVGTGVLLVVLTRCALSRASAVPDGG